MTKEQYVFTARAFGSNKDIATLESEWQTIQDNYYPVQPPVPVPDEQINAELVDTWLKGLKQSDIQEDNDLFESLRKKSLKEQYDAYVIANP